MKPFFHGFSKNPIAKKLDRTRPVPTDLVIRKNTYIGLISTFFSTLSAFGLFFSRFFSRFLLFL